MSRTTASLMIFFPMMTIKKKRTARKKENMTMMTPTMARVSFPVSLMMTMMRQ